MTELGDRANALSRPNAAVWLWAMLLAWRVQSGRRLLFSQRRRFFDALRPPAGAGAVIDWPDAIFWIRPRDVRRAKLAAQSKQRSCGPHNPQENKQ